MKYLAWNHETELDPLFIESRTAQEAKEKLAVHLLKEDEYFAEMVEERTANMSFWEPFAIQDFDESGNITCSSSEFRKRIFGRLAHNFSRETAEELLTYFFDEREHVSVKELSQETQLAVTFYLMEKEEYQIEPEANITII